MFTFSPNLSIKTQERLSYSQNAVQHDSKMETEISLVKVLLGMGKL